MKKILPFVFPLISLVIVLFLAFRWYSDRTDRGNITPFAENIEIEELSDAEVGQTLRGVGDFETVDLVNQGEGPESGEIRYEFEDGKVKFGVTANVDGETEGKYQVWLKDPDTDAIRKAFVLEDIKGGMSGTAAISAETLPFEVVVSQENEEVEYPENVILKGLIEEENSVSDEDCGEEACEIDIEELIK